MNRTVILTLIVICCGIFMLFMDERLRHPSGETIAVTISKSEAGRPLRTIFDGLPEMHIPRSLESAALPAIGSSGCGQQPTEWLASGIENLFRLTKVHASSSCLVTQCTGSWWTTYEEFCLGNCSIGGSWMQAIAGGYPGRNRQNGFRQYGSQACTWNPSVPPGSGDCICRLSICDNGAPFCDTKECDPQHPYQGGYNGCDPGYKCNSTACCEHYTCPTGQPYCQDLPGECLTLDPQAECSEGCCVPIYCVGDWQCTSPPQYRCIDHQCQKQSSCPDELCNPLDNSYEPADPCMYPGEPPNCRPGLQWDDATRCCLSGGSPIIIDVDGDGFQLTAPGDGVTFDLRGGGSRERWSWTAAGADDVWLSLDRNGNGLIDNGTELFGDATAQPDTPGKRNGFKALALFDQTSEGGNNDGVIDARDAVYVSLRLWRDANHNGSSESGELLSLQQVGITAISLKYKESKWTDAYGNQFKYRAKVERSTRGKGRDKWAYDVFLVADSTAQ